MQFPEGNSAPDEHISVKDEKNPGHAYGNSIMLIILVLTNVTEPYNFVENHF